MADAQTPELQSKIAIWRSKCLDCTITEAEMIEAIAALRQGRVSAAYASEGSRAKKAKAMIPSADDLLDELGNL
jgi:hypothetical protein